MSSKSKPLSLSLTTGIFILQGMTMFLFSCAGLFSFERVLHVLNTTPYVSELFMYSHFSGTVLTWVLIARLIVGIFQIIIGIMVLDFKVWALKAFRLIMLLAIILTLFNPYYPYPLVIFFLFVYSLIFYFLHHGHLESYFLDGQSAEKSKGVLILGCLEMVIGLLLLRGSLISIPLSGMTMEIMTRFDILLAFAVPKTALLFLAYLIFIAGLLTLSYAPTGRMLNTFFCGITFILTCLSVFLINQPQEHALRFSFLMFVVFTLIITGVFFLILTHPQVKTQFNRKCKSRYSQKITRALAFTLSCFIILSLLHLTRQNYPQYLQTSFLKQYLPQTYLMEDFDPSLAVKNIGKKVTSFIEEK